MNVWLTYLLACFTSLLPTGWCCLSHRSSRMQVSSTGVASSSDLFTTISWCMESLSWSVDSSCSISLGSVPCHCKSSRKPACLLDITNLPPSLQVQRWWSSSLVSQTACTHSLHSYLPSCSLFSSSSLKFALLSWSFIVAHSWSCYSWAMDLSQFRSLTLASEIKRRTSSNNLEN